MSIVCVGDFGKGNEDQLKVAVLIKKITGEKDVKLVLGLGDNIYPDGVKSVKDKKFKLQFEEMYKKLPKSLEFFNVLGNHDYRGNCNAQIEYTKKSNRWNLFNHWYNFNKTMGKSRVKVGFYAIDTNFDELTPTLKKKQSKEIIAALESSDCDWNIVYGHHPFKSTGYHGNAEGELKDFYNSLIETRKVHFMLAGHDHDQQLFNIPNLPTLVVSGTGSEAYHVPKVFRLNPQLEFYSEKLGVCSIDFTSKTSVQLTFYDAENDSSFKKIITKKN